MSRDISKPHVDVRCSSCMISSHPVALKHSKFTLWSLPKATEIDAIMERQGWIAQDDGFTCPDCQMNNEQ